MKLVDYITLTDEDIFECSKAACVATTATSSITDVAAPCAVCSDAGHARYYGIPFMGLRSDLVKDFAHAFDKKAAEIRLAKATSGTQTPGAPYGLTGWSKIDQSKWQDFRVWFKQQNSEARRRVVDSIKYEDLYLQAQEAMQKYAVDELANEGYNEDYGKGAK